MAATETAERPEPAVERTRAQMIRDGVVQNYRIEDFAACFGVSVRFAWDLIASGDVTAIKAGRRTLILAESARAWRERCPRVRPSRQRASGGEREHGEKDEAERGHG